MRPPDLHGLHDRRVGRDPLPRALGHRPPRVRQPYGTSYVTRALVAINVGVYLAELASGSGINAARGYIFEHGALVASAAYGNGSAAGVAHGEWWRLITAAFLHYGPIHLGMNMLALYWF